ncbi:MAG: transglycosylase SLT domain-containing protein [Bacteroidia bacterium]|nr:transglycosylase SLT domain-containing protein [Bacteroidia bacterium]
MANLELTLPFTDQGYYPTTDIPSIKKKLGSIASDFFNEIKQAETLTNVPAAIIISIIFAESGGVKDAANKSGSTGLMQLKPQSANDTILLEYKKDRLSQDEKTVLRKVLDDRLDSILSMNNLSDGCYVYQDDLLDTEFNILCGSILLGLLIDQHDENGVLRLDKVIMRYNRGYFFKPKGETAIETLAQAKQVSSELYNYILKITGVNGLIELQA